MKNIKISKNKKSIVIKIAIVILLLLDGVYIFLNHNVKEADSNNIITSIKNIKIFKSNDKKNVDYSYKNPFIPDGFKKINVANASWNNIDMSYDKGLVIQDSYGNQFVWVPVDEKLVKFQKDFTLPSIYNVNSYNTSDVLVQNNFDIKNSVEKYGGFYIARFESCFDYNNSNIRVASRKSKEAIDNFDWSSTRNQNYDGYLWNYINFEDAKKYSQDMAQVYKYNKNQVLTCLVTGDMWDTTIDWIKTNNILPDNQFGNYINSDGNAKVDGYGKIQISGYSNNWSINNIYDMAGNIWEWSCEKYSKANNEYISRGGSYIYDGTVYSAGYRTYNDGTKCYPRIGFRVGMILK